MYGRDNFKMIVSDCEWARSRECLVARSERRVSRERTTESHFFMSHKKVFYLPLQLEHGKVIGMWRT